MVLRWSNRRAWDHQNHVAPRRKPIPASQRSQLTKTLLCYVSFSKIRQFFADFHVSVCWYFEDTSVKKVSKSNSPRVSIVSQRIRIRCQWRNRSPEAEQSAPREQKRGADGDLESTSVWVPSRQAGDREIRSSYPSLWGVTEEKNTDVYFIETVPFFPWVVEGTSFAWGLKKKHSAARRFATLKRHLKKALRL